MSTQITPGLKNAIRQSVVGTSTLLEHSNAKSKYVRVLKVILNKSDVDDALWAALGYSQALYGVFYQDLYESNSDTRRYTTGNFAYCFNANIRRIPLPGELVTVQPMVRADRSQDSTVLQEATYWVDVVSAWNSPTSNFFVPSGSTEEIPEPQVNANPLQLNPGDLTIEGRYGQSIRFGGGYRKGGVSDEDTADSPYIIVRSGQGTNSTEGDTPVYEDINRDGSSIYLTTNQSIKLTEASSKSTSWKSNTPEITSGFKNSQIILNSDRVIANAKTNDVKILAKQNIALSAQRVGVDGGDFVSTDANKIYLGKYSQSEEEPVLKGKTTMEWLSQLCGILDSFLQSVSETEREELTAIAGTATALRVDLQALASSGRLEELGSEKVYVE